MPLDKNSFLATACAIVTGFALAGTFPEAASIAKSDPLTEAKEERIGLLKTAVRERFGNPASAAEWLNTRQPALGDSRPGSQLMSRRIWSAHSAWLHRPQKLAA